MKFCDVRITMGCYFDAGSGDTDLHNNWDFRGIVLEREKHRCILRWDRSVLGKSEGVPHRSLKLIFEGIDFFWLKPADIKESDAEPGLLNFAGRLHPDDTEIMDGFLDHDDTESDYPMIFGFGDGFAVKLRSETVIAEFS
jgi:hypothetical protein